MRLTERVADLDDFLSSQNAAHDMAQFKAINRERSELLPATERFAQYLSIENDLKTAREWLSDPDMRDMAREEIAQNEGQLQAIEEELQRLMLPKDPNDHRNAMLEIRAGTGGDEACIFVEDVYRMYTMYFKAMGWNVDVLNSSEGSVKGYKEISMEITGAGIYGALKFESGVHRVQRVPETESQGRVHTSAITVAVLPEAEEVDFELDMNDVRKDTFRASGAGGQHINKTESAIRLTHIPSGLVVECQDGRSQHKNLEKAISVLRSRLYQLELDRIHNERAAQRKTLVSTGDRSAKIRTYNYPQGRITDHRINKTMYNLNVFMNGDIQEMLDALKMAENAEKLKGETA